MPSIIELTPLQPVVLTLTSNPQRQALFEAVDVGLYDLLDLEVVLVDAPSGVGVTLGLATGMQRDTEVGWVDGSVNGEYYDFDIIYGGGATARRFSAGLLRYVRWTYRTTTGGLGQTISFFIRGMARSYSGNAI